ncbi:MAG: hypothetical protein R2864_13145 [Syntrophotaleaceae bacterium]
MAQCSTSILQTNILIAGHTDSTSGEGTARKLSERRAGSAQPVDRLRRFHHAPDRRQLQQRPGLSPTTARQPAEPPGSDYHHPARNSNNSIPINRRIELRWTNDKARSQPGAGFVTAGIAAVFLT